MPVELGSPARFRCESWSKRAPMASKMENWELGDYCKHFHEAVAKSSDQIFRNKFDALARELGTLDAEFLLEKVKCGGELGDLVRALETITGKLGYCERDRDFEQTCGALYAEVDAAIAQAQALNERCFR